MGHSTERECNVCGNKYFSPEKCPCPRYKCTGTMCRVITPLPGKRMSGVLMRDKAPVESCKTEEIQFLPNGSLSEVERTSSGWYWKEHGPSWSVEQWKEQYGKLPRKGSKQMVIIELASNGK